VPFQSKVDMAVEELEQFEPVPGTHTHVLVDSWYHCKRVRKVARKRGWDFSGGLKSNRKMRIIAQDGSRQWLSLSEYAATLEPEDWDEAIWPSQQGGHPVYVHAVRTWVRKLGPTLVLITRPSPDAPLERTRYWGSSLVDADAQPLIDILAIRWNIEIVFTQMTKARMSTGFGSWDDVADFDLGVIDDNAVNQQFNQFSLLGKGCLLQSSLDSVAEGFNRRCDPINLDLLVDLEF
jgi:hypothetical protein